MASAQGSWPTTVGNMLASPGPPITLSLQQLEPPSYHILPWELRMHTAVWQEWSRHGPRSASSPAHFGFGFNSDHLEQVRPDLEGRVSGRVSCVTVTWVGGGVGSPPPSGRDLMSSGQG